jgi:outer membrane protein assembly factor BamB
MGLALFWPLALWGADWPQWGGRNDRNMVSAEKGLPTTFEPGKKSPQGSGIDPATTRNVRWTAKLGSQTYGSPVIAGGKVFIGTNDEDVADVRYQPTCGGLLKCLDEASGKLLWQLVVPLRKGDPEYVAFDGLNLGICSSPTVEGDRVYVVTNRNDVLCLDIHGMANGNQGPFLNETHYTVPQGEPPVPLTPRDGDILWAFDMTAELPCCPEDAADCSVLIHGDLLYVCTANGVDKSQDSVPFPLAPSLIVLDKHTGRLVAMDDEKIGTRLFHGQWSAPSLATVGGKTLVFFGGGDGVCYAFEAVSRVQRYPTGLKKVWSFDCNPPEYRFRDGKPIAYRDGDKRLKKGNHNDGLYVGPSEIIATPVFYRDRVYVAIGRDPAHGRGKGALHCIDATQTGDITQSGKIWSYTDLDRSISTLAIADGRLYAADIAGRIHCLDAASGKPHWVHDTKSEIWSSVLVADGRVHLGTRKGLLVLADSKELKILNEVHVGSPVYCTPVAANGVLYVASQKYLWAVQKQD